MPGSLVNFISGNLGSQVYKRQSNMGGEREIVKKCVGVGK